MEVLKTERESRIIRHKKNTKNLFLFQLNYYLGQIRKSIG